MISLLERLVVAEQEPRIGGDVSTGRASQLLEWTRVTDQIATLCINGPAAERIRRRRPFATREPIQLIHDLADEMRPAGDVENWPPLVDVAGALSILDAPLAGRLDGPDLVHLAGVAEDLERLRAFFLRAREQYPVWSEAAVQMTTFAPLASEIRRALDREGHIRDDASPLLSRLRSQAVKQERKVRRTVDSAMAQARRKGWTTADEVTLRGDRFCLPLRSGDSRKISGIVHDRSATGNTLFVEPAAAVQLHNDLTEARFEIAAEEMRILATLNRSFEQAAPGLREACRLLLLVDEIRAGLLWSRKYVCRRPRLVAGGRLRLCRARHPLLLQFGPRALAGATAAIEMPADDAGGAGGKGGASDAGGLHDAGDADAAGEVVPLDLELPDDTQVVVLSGPNAGGKSVALKTAGVLVMLAQCGWDIPAREDTRLPLVERLFVDLGDEQSIEKSLSSFSAHLGNIGRFLDEADGNSLVLCDEIGSGTDPQEGTALAFAILERLAAVGATVLASTHFGLLKAAVHDHPAMVNAAMDYDEQSLRPLFTFRLGDPGASRAFDIAARWGFADELLDRARGLVGEERFQIERLLGELNNRARALADSQRDLEQRAADVKQRQDALTNRLRGIDREEKRVLESTRELGQQLLAESRRAIEAAVREIRSSAADPEAVRRARRRLEELTRRLPAPEQPAAPPPVATGQRVRIPHLGLVGTVVEVRGERLVALADGLRLTVARGAVECIDADGAPLGGSEDAATHRPPARDASWRWHDTPSEIQHEIDLRGTTGEEGWLQLDRLIDRAIPVGLDEILVIHGIGTGRLREFLHERLTADDRVRSCADAPRSRGGFGATIVRLA